ncbi:unnamed protein product [Protopolystoma xenopodis]|uniref:Uncharacterized protein n=1 Tax=Protopolystoma xenopodis TaxID=117903 RepID=A0A448WBM5_9PLAT|nr:unnamed protein product [Protopolystoma xenopodis]
MGNGLNNVNMAPALVLGLPIPSSSSLYKKPCIGQLQVACGSSHSVAWFMPDSSHEFFINSPTVLMAAHLSARDLRRGNRFSSCISMASFRLQQIHSFGGLINSAVKSAFPNCPRGFIGELYAEKAIEKARRKDEFGSYNAPGSGDIFGFRPVPFLTSKQDPIGYQCIELLQNHASEDPDCLLTNLERVSSKLSTTSSAPVRQASILSSLRHPFTSGSSSLTTHTLRGANKEMGWRGEDQPNVRKNENDKATTASNSDEVFASVSFVDEDILSLPFDNILVSLGSPGMAGELGMTKAYISAHQEV